MTLHPRERRPKLDPEEFLDNLDGVSRRDFLKRSAGAALALSGGAALLAACGKGTPVGVSSSGIQLPRVNHPVKWPSGKTIADGLMPEQNATLKLYNWTAYIYKKVLTDFEKKYKKYNVAVQLTTFDTMDQAIGTISSGQADFDVFFPTIDRLGPIISKKLLRPLNHSYIPNISNVWPVFENPFYDQGWQYTVPYVAYTTGVAWRADHVSEDIASMPNPYDALWLTKYKGKIEVLDDYREGISMALLKNGIADVNTGDSKSLNTAKQTLLNLAQTTNPLVNIQDYNDLPTGKTWINQAWSGDMVNAQYYAPGNASQIAKTVAALRYWHAPKNQPVNTDTMAILSTGKNPVLAHLFLNYMLDYGNAVENFSWLGYQPPQSKLNTKLLVSQSYVPQNLASTVVTQDDWANGVRELELAPVIDAQWHQIWTQFKAGG